LTTKRKTFPVSEGGGASLGTVEAANTNLGLSHKWTQKRQSMPKASCVVNEFGIKKKKSMSPVPGLLRKRHASSNVLSRRTDGVAKDL